MNLETFETLGLGGIFADLLSAIKVFERSEDGQHRRNLKVLQKARKKAYRMFKKDGKIDVYEKDLLILADAAIIKAMQNLAK